MHTLASSLLYKYNIAGVVTEPKVRLKWSKEVMG